MATWGVEMEIKASPAEIAPLATWLKRLHEDIAVAVSGPDARGVYEVTVRNTPIPHMEDAETIIRRWDLAHPGAILEPPNHPAP